MATPLIYFVRSYQPPKYAFSQVAMRCRKSQIGSKSLRYFISPWTVKNIHSWQIILIRLLRARLFRSTISSALSGFKSPQDGDWIKLVQFFQICLLFCCFGLFWPWSVQTNRWSIFASCFIKYFFSMGCMWVFICWLFWIFNKMSCGITSLIQHAFCSLFYAINNNSLTLKSPFSSGRVWKHSIVECSLGKRLLLNHRAPFAGMF